MQTQQGGYTPIKFSSKDVRILKPPKAPEKPLMPYMRYSKKVWEQVKASNPQFKLWEVGKIIGQMWRELSDEEKNAFVEEYDTEKVHYAEQLRQYHSSSAYQAWLAAKERGIFINIYVANLAERSTEDDHDRKSQTRGRDREGQSDFRESYILEDNEEDMDDNFTVKHIAASRFQRNHRLMQEVLSDARLPDSCHLISESRLKTLKMQVEQLRNHKKNLCQEIDACELKHHSKLKRIREDSSKLYEEYNKIVVNKPSISENQFAEMIIKAKIDMAREEEERRERQLAEIEARRKRAQLKLQKENEMSLEAEKKLNAQKSLAVPQGNNPETNPNDLNTSSQSARLNPNTNNGNMSVSKAQSATQHQNVSGHTQHHFPSGNSTEIVKKSDSNEVQGKMDKKEQETSKIVPGTPSNVSLPYSAPHQMPYSHPQYSNYMSSGGSPYSNIYPGGSIASQRPSGHNPYGSHHMSNHPSVNSQSGHPPPPPMYHPHHLGAGGPNSHPGVMSHHHPPWGHYGPHQNMYGQVHPQNGHQQQLPPGSQPGRYQPSMNPQYGRPPAPPPYHQQHLGSNAGNSNSGAPYWSSTSTAESVAPNTTANVPTNISQASTTIASSGETTSVSSHNTQNMHSNPPHGNMVMQNQSHMPMPPNSMMYPSHSHHPHGQNATYPHMHPNSHGSHPSGPPIPSPYGPHPGQPYGNMPPHQQNQMHTVNPAYYPHHGPISQQNQHGGNSNAPHMMMLPPQSNMGAHQQHQGPWNHTSGGAAMSSHYPPNAYTQHNEYSSIPPNQNPHFIPPSAEPNVSQRPEPPVTSNSPLMSGVRPSSNPQSQAAVQNVQSTPLIGQSNSSTNGNNSEILTSTASCVSSASSMSDVPNARPGSETPHGSQTPNSNSGSN